MDYPIPNSGAGGVNVASYTLTNVNNPQDVVYEVRAVNELGEGSVSAPVSPSDRTPQVAEAILNVVKLDYPTSPASRISPAATSLNYCLISEW